MGLYELDQELYQAKQTYNEKWEAFKDIKEAKYIHNNVMGVAFLRLKLLVDTDKKTPWQKERLEEIFALLLTEEEYTAHKHAHGCLTAIKIEMGIAFQEVKEAEGYIEYIKERING